jgi:spore coat polysaccharide biosynthesis predicted glycosyltransferase SpsG
VPGRPADQILIATGGGDPGGIAAGLAAAVRTAVPVGIVTLVRGPQAVFSPPDGVDLLDRPPDLLEPLLGADIAVVTGGQTLCEALASGVAAVVIPVADNQRAAADRAAQSGAAILAEDIESAARAAALLARDPARRAALAGAAQRHVDGYGALRVGFAAKRLLEAVA